MPLFAALNKHEVQEIARLFKEHRFSKGETIVQERSAGNTLFLIESGEAGVFIGGIGRTTMRSPDYFGEVALFDEGTRMATIRASSEVVCYALTGRERKTNSDPTSSHRGQNGLRLSSVAALDSDLHNWTSAQYPMTRERIGSWKPVQWFWKELAA